ncbi:unnamed protein product [Nippostrongylus brasiliensis]|uniref:Uncharacterized protein n=1 Tax=Nippostrongylus brasiliensis TaxID=27835 RepID=A0A0N4XH15_NIPBR|nr:unnamed protein product [Nippostrongylus brasiliensis]
MLLFSQQELGSYAQELQSKARDVLFGVRHLRLCFGGAVSGMLISYWNDSEVRNSNAGISRPMLVVFACLWIFIIYAVIIIERYCDYSRTLKLLQRRIGVNVEVFKERVFGTPPLKEFHRMEHPRCSQMSDSLLENIFDDYEPEPALY